MVTEGNTEPRPNRLRVLRAERHLTQWDTAAGVGISFNRYWRIEHGRAMPTDEERQRLAEFFGVAPRKVFPAQPKRPMAQAA
jgi:transcriptional regulator with XRE-family HTH domain